MVSEAVTVGAVLLVLLAETPFLAGLGLFLVGFGNGPVFPNMTHLAPIHYGKSRSQAFIGLQGAVAYAAFLTLPLLTGVLMEHVSSDVFPWLLVCAMALTGTATYATLTLHAKRTKAAP